MKRTNKKHLFILFSLMEYLKKVNKQFNKKPLEASVSKIEFIRLLQSTKITEKSERGLYKNLEILEKKKLISYENRFLKLTKKGLINAEKIEKEIGPYVKVIDKIEKQKIQTKKSLQAYFK